MLGLGATTTPTDPISALAHWARAEPDRPCLQWEIGTPLTYAELLSSVRDLAGGLAAAGVKQGDTVLLLLPNGVEFVQCWLAVNYLGAVEVPVNVHERGRFLEHVLEDSRAEILIADASLLDRVASVEGALTRLRQVFVVGEGESRTRFATASLSSVSEGASTADLVQVDARDLMAIFYTSGTTGPAKGIMFTYGQGILCAQNLADIAALTDDDTYSVCMPLFHSNAQTIQVMPALMAGARIVLWSGFRAASWLDDIRAVGATVTNTLGVMSQTLFDQPERDDDAHNPLRLVQTIPMPRAIGERFERRFGVECVDGYGLTDVGMISFRRRDEPLVPGSSGRPMPGYEVVIADPETDKPLPRNTVGEILVRPNVPYAVMAGYWNNPEATVAAWRNLWFHTGDAGYLDDDGRLYFHERLKDAIRVRGENVSSAQVEAEFLTHPAVAECAAVAVPSERGDDEIKLCVVVRDGATVRPEELLDWCAPNMPYFAVPRFVEFMTELPKTATGKVRKVELRGQASTVAAWDRKAAGYSIAR